MAPKSFESSKIHRPSALVVIFTDEDYNRAKAMYDERMANYRSGEK
jgi:hypothetical protein